MNIQIPLSIQNDKQCVVSDSACTWRNENILQSAHARTGFKIVNVFYTSMYLQK